MKTGKQYAKAVFLTSGTCSHFLLLN